jgi:hypothetical protein
MNILAIIIFLVAVCGLFVFWKTVSANQIWFGIIIAVSMICVAIAGFISYKKPKTTNKKIVLIAVVVPIIVFILFISDLFY